MDTENKVIESRVVHEDDGVFVYETYENGYRLRRQAVLGVDYEMDKSEAMMCEMAVKVEYLTALVELGMEV